MEKQPETFDEWWNRLNDDRYGRIFRAYLEGKIPFHIAGLLLHAPVDCSRGYPETQGRVTHRTRRETRGDDGD